MLKSWPVIIVIIAFILLTLQKSEEVKALGRGFHAERPIKLKAFEEARKKVSRDELDLLKLWESILTGRSAPLSKWMREKYSSLGLNHVFTPSGFHLSAILFPFMKIFKQQQHQLFIFLIIGIGLMFVSGMSALKRMVLIKSAQKITSLKTGFVIALLLDILFGSFQSNILSFTYSFLFLGIIYSGMEGLKLLIAFFFSQTLIAYFQDNDVSLLIILFSPILNFSFGLIMPLLFLLAAPLWDWQLGCGIFLLKIVQALVDFSAYCISFMPTLEINIVTLVLIVFLIYRKWKSAIAIMLCFSTSLNLSRTKIPHWGKYEFSPQGIHVLTKYNERNVFVKFTDGSCRMMLVRGMWFENCSPLKRGSRKKKIKKFSNHSQEQQMSSLHEWRT